MNSVNDLNKYKEALKFVEELEPLLKDLEAIQKRLIKYVRYAPVRKVLEAIHDNQVLLEIHLENQKRIVDTKGNIQ